MSPLITRFLLILVGIIGLLAIAFIAINTDLFLYLRTQVPITITSETEQSFTCSPSTSDRVGEYKLTLAASDSQGNATSQEVTINVLAASAAPTVMPDLKKEPIDKSDYRTFIFQAERGHSISGNYSRAELDNNRGIATIAHEKASFGKKVQVPRSNYWLYINAKHDKPGPVDVAIYVNNRAWKVIRLDKNDNRYRTHRVGRLRNFANATIRFRFLNDVWDANDPNNANKDRNLHVDWWALSENSKQPAVTNKKFSPKQSAGIQILPRLNSIIREELGPQHINLDIWHFYAKRLTIVPTALESIQTEDHLRKVMRYWKGANPSRPRGL